MVTKKRKTELDAVQEELHAKTGLPRSAFGNAAKQIRNHSEDFRRVYANSFKVNQSPWDISITFGEIVGQKDGEPVHEETVQVTITREISKVLIALIQHQIDAFEAVQGEIRMPKVVDDDEAETNGKPKK